MRVWFPLVLLCLAGLAQAGAIDEKVEAALAAESRPEADVERDRNRKPLETLKFFGLEDDMTVLELIPGGGWYTRVLAPVLAENGKLYVSLGTGYVSENVLTEPGFEKVEVIVRAIEEVENDHDHHEKLFEETAVFGVGRKVMAGEEVHLEKAIEIPARAPWSIAVPNNEVDWEVDLTITLQGHSAHWSVERKLLVLP